MIHLRFSLIQSFDASDILAYQNQMLWQLQFVDIFFRKVSLANHLSVDVVDVSNFFWVVVYNGLERILIC